MTKTFLWKKHFYQFWPGIAASLLQFLFSVCSKTKTTTSCPLMCNIGKNQFRPLQNLGHAFNVEYSWMGSNFFALWKHYWMTPVHFVKKKPPSYQEYTSPYYIKSNTDQRYFIYMDRYNLDDVSRSHLTYIDYSFSTFFTDTSRCRTKTAE